MKKLLCLIITFFFVIPSVIASSCEANPDYEKWLQLSDSERENIPEPLPYVCYLDKKELKKLSSSQSTKMISTENGVKTISATDARYDSRDYGVISSIKDQGHYGNCWAQTGNALFETAAIISGFKEYNFSEKSVIVNTFYDVFKDRYNVGGYNGGPDEGGNIFMYASYLYRHQGPVFEEDYPYLSEDPNIEYSNINSNSLPNTKPLLELDSLNLIVADGNCSDAKKSVIKNALITYGAVGTSLHSISGMPTYYVEKNNSLLPNHEVTIIGWDDNIPASKFGNGVTTNGGWLIKNSWGSSRGDNGIYYVSYEDAVVCDEFYYFSGVQLNNYDNAYATSEQSVNYIDELAQNTNKYYQSIKMSTKNSNVTEYLGKVSLFLTPGETIDIYYGKNGPDKKDEYLGSITSYSLGLSSVEFPEIPVKGDYYINLVYNYQSNNRYNNTYALSCKTDAESSFSYTLTDYTGGKYYYSYDGSHFTDISTLSYNDQGIHYDNCRPSVYVYTKSVLGNEMSLTFVSTTTETGDDVYINSGDYFDIAFTPDNITDNRLYSVRVVDQQMNTDLSNMFNIDVTHINSNHVYVTPTQAPAGSYYVNVRYGNIGFYALIQVKDYIYSTTYARENNYILINPVKGTDYTVSTMENSITFNTTNTRTYLSKTGTALNTQSKITTGSKLRIRNTEYTFIILGDVNGDGLIRSNDYIFIKNHIMEYSTMTDPIQLKAADCTRDGNIRSNDYIAIKNYIMSS